MSDAAIKPGSTIFVTGVNGLIGSYIVDELLKLGYNVRGAVRDTQKSAWLLDYFTGKYSSTLDLVSVPDMTVDGCYDDVVKGTSGFIHVASPLGGTDPHTTIPIGIASAINALSTCTSTPSIAATFPSNGIPKALSQSSWNEEGIRKGWSHPASDPDALRGLYIYAALKTESEKAMFDRIGEVVKPQFYISTQDLHATGHVAALLHPTLTSTRLFGFAQKWDFNTLLAIYRRTFPDRSFPEDLPNLVEDLSEPPSARAEEILAWLKKDERGEGMGWDDLETTVVEMAGQFASGEV
ncbi:NAD(P)-binding protein [Bimuria novae-zelandiae CBS 107.79]|uniref:NAD(P)-binding protein n=1 Tax=Bimuria novae-zelandiae CBS 107.79 TaxID=1447943 RepID=A0A6A5VFK5_9PLEO|nr:NAD(P)-binding protein [Bimuria novae-zelandiae CBS 107.79]